MQPHIQPGAASRARMTAPAADLATASRQSFRRVVTIDESFSCLGHSDVAARERRTAFEEGAWHLIGVQAAAQVELPAGARMVSRTITSPGRFGIESDAEEEFLDDVFAAECDQLASLLAAQGITVLP